MLNKSALSQSIVINQVKQVKRTGEIDFLRFVFSVALVFHHFEGNYDYGIFAAAAISVEFFFLVSGYLMARHVAQLRDRPQTWGDIADCTWKYLLKKIGSIYRYYFMVVILNFLVRNILIRHQSATTAFQQLLGSLPTFSLVFMGLNCTYVTMYVGNTWYLSAMVIAIFILYPLLLKQFRLSTKIIFPLLSVSLLGYLCHAYGKITSWNDWNGICYSGVLRSTAVMSLGASLYQVSESVKKCYDQWKYAETFGGKMLPTILKAMCYGVVLIYCYNGSLFGKIPTLHVMLFCAIGVTLSFGEMGYSIGDSKVTRYLGKISMPIFIFHGFLRWTCKDLTGDAFISFKMSLLLIAACILISIAFMYITDFIFARIKPLFAKKETT